MSVYWIPWSGEATGVALQMREQADCAVCSGTTVHRAIERTMQFPMCSG